MENPLAAKLQTNQAILDAAEVSGLSEGTIRNLIRYQPEGIGKIRIETMLAIKQHLGVDLLKWHLANK